MKASQESKRSYEKAVTFDALETIEQIVIILTN